MKKTLILCLIMFSSTYCFAQEGVYGDFEFFTGMPFIYGNLNNGEKETVKTEMPFSFGMGAANYNVFKVRNLGIYFAGTFIFPKTLVHTVNGQPNNYERNDIWVFDMLFGIGYHLLGKEGAFRLPVTLGLHFLLISGIESTPKKTQELNILGSGLGGSITGEMHINSLIYLFAGLRFFIDFFSFAEHIIELLGNFSF